MTLPDEGENLPFGHSVQFPDVGSKEFPAGHGLQLLFLEFGDVPFRQWVHLEAPNMTDTFPGGQSPHALLALPPFPGLYLPGAHW